MLDVKNLKVKLKEKILDSNRLFIIPHRNADADAIASAVGMSLISNKLKRENHILIGDDISILHPGVQTMIDQVHNNYSIVDVGQYEELKDGDSLDVLCDVNTQERTFATQLDREKLVIIDHHSIDSKTPDASVSHIDIDASSASEIITNLLLEFKIGIPEEVATMLLAGIIVDTNHYQNNNATGFTHKTISELMELGAEKQRAEELYFVKDYDSEMRLYELIKNNTHFIDFKMAIMALSDDEVHSKEELAQAADWLAEHKDKVDAAYAIGRQANGHVSISSRSKGKVDVAQVMREIGGNGDPNRAGSEYENTTVEEVRKKLEKVIFPAHYIGQTKKEA